MHVLAFLVESVTFSPLLQACELQHALSLNHTVNVFTSSGHDPRAASLRTSPCNQRGKGYGTW